MLSYYYDNYTIIFNSYLLVITPLTVYFKIFLKPLSVKFQFLIGRYISCEILCQFSDRKSFWNFEIQIS